MSTVLYINAEASVYRNNARTLRDNRFLQVRLEGEGANRFGVGARVTVGNGAETLAQELMPSRGFQSSVDYVLTFGLGARDTAPSVTVAWPDGRVTTLQAVAANQRVTVRQADAAPSAPDARPPAPPLLTDVTAHVALGDPHRENKFVDFRSQPLMPMMLSTQGPPMAVADVNGDGLDDAFIGGAREQAGQLLLQRPDGSKKDRLLGLFCYMMFHILYRPRKYESTTPKKPNRAKLRIKSPTGTPVV